jgi:hypothetical protein
MRSWGSRGDADALNSPPSDANTVSESPEAWARNRYTKAPADWRSPKAGAYSHGLRDSRSVLECGQSSAAFAYLVSSAGMRMVKRRKRRAPTRNEGAEISDALPTGRQNPQPGRAKDNSPRIHPWGRGSCWEQVPSGTKEDVRFIPRVLSPLRGLGDLGTR